MAALITRAGEPEVVLEIGSWKGGTLWAWTQVAAPDALIVAVDLPVTGYERNISSVTSLANRMQRIELVRGNSHDPSTLETVRQLLAGLSVDLLFIDGDHTYEGVKLDYEMYSPLVRDGGLIALHDILPQEGAQVDKFWRELAGEALVDPTDVAARGQWGGIGVLLVGER